MQSRQISRLAGSSSPFGMSNFGGAFLLLNALSTRIYNLIEDSTSTIVAGYEKGGILGMLVDPNIRALIQRYLWLLSIAFAFEKLRRLWGVFSITGSLSQCNFAVLWMFFSMAMLILCDRLLY